MATKIIDDNGTLCFDSISSEENLKLRPRKNINSPPTFRRCCCCGRHISKLKPFGKEGDPLVGNFEGALLIKTFRPVLIPSEEAEDAYEKALSIYKSEGYNNPLDWMKMEYGEDEGESLYEGALCESVGKSWECRDCIVLDRQEYLEKCDKRYSQGEIQNCHEQHDHEDEKFLRELDNM